MSLARPKVLSLKPQIASESLSNFSLDGTSAAFFLDLQRVHGWTHEPQYSWRHHVVQAQPEVNSQYLFLGMSRQDSLSRHDVFVPICSATHLNVGGPSAAIADAA